MVRSPSPILRSILVFSLAALASTCGHSGSGPTSPEGGPLNLAALPGIEAFEPTSSRVGRTLELRVTGEDFLEGDEIALEREELILDDVETLETRFVSDREVIATVRIDLRAAVGPYGVTVRRGGRKRGTALDHFFILPPAEEPSAPPDTTPGAPPLSLGTLPGKIAFVRNEFRGLEPPWQLGDIHIFQAGLVWNASRHPSDDRDPSLSPDGLRVAFTSNRTGDYEIYVMNVDGSAVTRITNMLGVNHQPVWSPDGERIAFAYDPLNTIVPENRWDQEFEGGYDIWVMDADGSNLRQVTQGSELEGVLGLDWSPDGNRIVYTAVLPGTGFPEGNLAVISIEGGGPVILTQEFGLEHSPSWNPDGSIIYSKPEQLFRIYVDGIPRQIFPYTEVRIQGLYSVREGESSRLIAGGFESARFWPSGSPDGTQSVLTRIEKVHPPILLSAEELGRFSYFRNWSSGTTERSPRSTGILHVPILTVLDSFGRSIDLPRISGEVISEARGDTLVFVDGYPSTYDSDPDWGP